VARYGGAAVTDTDREASAAQLREHYAAGRLSLDEFQDRLDAVYRAQDSGSRDGATVATAWRRAGSVRAGMGINGSSPCGYSAVIPARLLSRPVTQ
jgi:hypothetical protein